MVSTDGPGSKESISPKDGETRQLDASIVALKLQQNKLVSAISTLPVEMLTEIFQILKTPDFSINAVQELINLTHVCRDWRNLVINTPSLWDEPPLRGYPFSLHWTDEWFKRSQNAPLTIFVSFTDIKFSKVVGFFQMFLRHFSRVRRLHILWVYPSSILVDNIPSHAPNLESLSMQLNENRNRPGDFMTLPDNALCQLDAIRSIHYSGFVINWDRHLHGTLKRLALGGIPRSALPTISQFWDALKRMPLLEVLILNDAIPVLERIPLIHQTIALAFLQKLTVWSGVTEVETLLRGITFPPTAVVEIECLQHNPTKTTDFSGILSLVARSTLSGVKPLNFTNITLSELGSVLSVQISEALPPENGRRFNSATTVFLSLTFNWFEASNTTTIPKVLGDIFREFPLHQVVCMRVNDISRQLSSKMIRETFGVLPKLESLEFNGVDFLHALRSHLSSPKPSGDSPPGEFQGITFPTLRHITVFDPNFNILDDAKGYSELNACLLWRRNQHVGVQSLTLFTKWEIYSQDITLLSSVVDRFECYLISLASGGYRRIVGSDQASLARLQT